MSRTPRPNHVRAPNKAANFETHRAISADRVYKNLVKLFAELGVKCKSIPATKTTKDQPKSNRGYKEDGVAIGEILTAWHQDPRYLDSLGSPVPLKLRGSVRSFGRLVKDNIPYLDADLLLAHLQRVGAASIDQRGFVHVEMRSLPVYQDRLMAIQHTLMSLNNFIGTLRHNLDSADSNSEQLFHRIARNVKFDTREIPALKVWAKRHGHDFLETSDNWMRRRVRTGSPRASKNGKSARVSIGVYLAIDRE